MTAATPSEKIEENALSAVSAKIELDVDAIRSRCDQVLGQELYWFPVRHHSPAVAHHLRSVIMKRRPKMIFIEGPYEANHLIPHVVDVKTKPPVAIYCSYRDDENVLGLAGIASPAEHIPARFSCWYPLLSYSPEYVAMAAAKEIGCAVKFIDLPHHAQIKPALRLKNPESNGDSGAADDLAVVDGLKETAEPSDQKEGTGSKDAKDSTESIDPKDSKDSKDSNDSSSVAGNKPGVELGERLTRTDKLMLESGFYQALAAVAGFRNWNEAWDSLFEIRTFDGDPENFRRELAVFCAAARATSQSSEVAGDGTFERERFMLKTIRETLAQESLSAQDCLVVCGGFHLFMDAEDQKPPPEEPAGTIYTTVVPYSYFRLSELAGYGAGNRAPHFYQTAWELGIKNRSKDLLIEHVVQVLKQARREGEPLSSADAISTCQHAEMLARLRGRPAPVLDDIHDALITCCCKGNPAEDGVQLRKAMAAAGIGTKIGRVTDALGQLPIVSDFYAQLSNLELGEVMQKESRINLTLDKRNELANRQSIFLHRVNFLGIPLGAQTEAPSADFASGTLFKEKWGLRWSPNVESALIEKNLYGDTLESAALAGLREQLAQQDMHAGKTSAMLLNAANMDLPNLIQQVEAALSKAIDNDSVFVSLSQALNNLVVLERYAIYRHLRRGLLDDLIERCFDRACFSIIDVIAVPEDQQKGVLTGLLTLAEIILRGDRPQLDRALFVEHVNEAAEATEVAFLRGVFLGVLTELRVKTPDDLAKQISMLAKSAPEIMVTAGDLLDGIMAASRASIMLGAKSLVASVDELLRAADWDQFLIMVPRMRAAFERLHGSQLDAVAETVAHLYGLEESESLTELRTSVGAAALLAKIDQKVASIMKEWDF
jgi:hypothetical protein